MQKYIIRRLLLAIPTIWIVVSLVFLAVRALPGDFVTTKLAQLEGQGSETRLHTVEGETVAEATTYRVVLGDTIDEIAVKTELPVADLLALNPGLADAPPDPGDRLVVIDGQPLSTIMTRHKVTAEQLIELNPGNGWVDETSIAVTGGTVVLRESVSIQELADTRRIQASDILVVNQLGTVANEDGLLAADTLLLPGETVVLPTTKITEADIRHRLGVDRPLWKQYFTYLWDTVRGDFGRSFQTNEAALSQVGRVLPRTIQLGAYSLVVALVVAIPVGVFSAIRQDSAWDYVLRGFSITALAAPVFWTATMLIFVVTPGGIFGGGLFAIPFTDVDARNIWDSPGGFFRLYSIPAIAGGLAAGAGLMRITRSALLEVLRQDYLRTAWAKGLRERTIIVRHAFKNALIPVLSVLGLQLAALLGGTVVLEVLFNIPGMGRFLLERIIQQDIPPIQTIVLIFAIFTIGVNLIIDLSYALVDPRIRYS